MNILDLHSIPNKTRLKTDLAIIGAGPAGLTVARAFAGSHCHVLVLESGERAFAPEIQALNAVENIGEPVVRAGAEPLGRGYTDELSWLNSVPAFELRNRVVGGSTHSWIGKCAAFDAMDFARRRWVPDSGWPIARSGLVPFIERAGAALNLGPNLYDETLYARLRTPPADPGIDPALLRPFFWQFSHARRRPGQPLRFSEEIRRCNARNIEIVTSATVTHLNLEASGRKVASLEVRSLGGGHVLVEADTVVLCAGGIENARLLLASNGLFPDGVGNGRDVVGRYLADHPRTALARFDAPDCAAISERFGFYGLTHARASHFYLHGLALSPQLQEREGLLNCAAYPVQMLAADDPWLALKRAARSGTQQRRHLRTALAEPGMLAVGAYRRLVQKRGLKRKVEAIRFDAMVEQRPDRESRVTLSDKRDGLGVPLARVDWKISKQEIDSLAQLGRTMRAEFERVGLPAPVLADWICGDRDRAAFGDMAHPACTTRMGTDPATSVVDTDCRVHGIEGLYVAGSSVFPTSGHANPTLMIVALAMRLADHLKARPADKAGQPRAAASPAPADAASLK